MKHLFYNESDLDQLNGGLSIGRYFLSREKYGVIEEIIDYLFDTRITDGENIKWKFKVYGSENLFSFDLSLAHGITGILYFLLEAYKKNILKNKCKILIQGAINFLLNNIQDFEKIRCLFPNKHTEKKKYQHSRLAWCYGDLGILYVLFKAANLLGDVYLKKICIDGFIKNTQRQEFKDTKVMDVGFCHGASGIAYIYYKMYLLTAKIEFKNTAYYWIEKVLENSDKTNNISSYQFYVGNFEKRGFQDCYELLEGVIGVALVYNTFLHKNTDWDECLLLN